MVIECRTRPRKDGSKYTNCYGEGSKKPTKKNTSTNSIMQRKIVEKKLQIEDARIKNLLAGLDAENVRAPKPIKGVPRGGLLEAKLRAKAKERDANVKLVTDMVRKQRTKAKQGASGGVMDAKIRAKAAEKKRRQK